jgi:DNA-binding NarL/FixJ family response regulator
MAELNGIDATAELKNALPGIRVLVLSMHNAADMVRRALAAGASGYLVKDSAPRELRMAIEAIQRGEVYLGSRVSGRFLRGPNTGESEGARPSLESLTPRQRQTLRLIAEGKGTREIASALGVSVKTAESHRAAIMTRLGIHDIAGLVIFAVRHHLVDL